jgi:hypothetical protein
VVLSRELSVASEGKRPRSGDTEYLTQDKKGVGYGGGGWEGGSSIRPIH